jgi:hypothetical protein
VRFRRLLGCALLIVWAVQGLVLLILTFRGQHAPWLGYSIAATTSLILLSGGPGLRPPQPRPRARVLVFAGRVLLVLTWLARAVVAGFIGYAVAGVPEDSVYDLRLVVSVLIGWALSRVGGVGRLLAGFPPEKRFGVRMVVRGVLTLAVTVAAAAFAHQLEAAAAAVLFWVPSRAYAMFYGWWSTPFFAVPMSAPVWVLWFLVVTAAAVSLINTSKRVFGGDNEVGKWAEGLEVVKFEVNGQRPGCLLTWYGWTGEPVSPWRAAWLERKHRPLPYREDGVLRDRISTTLRATVPQAGWEQLRVSYRAAGSHEELDGQLDGTPWPMPSGGQLDDLLRDLRRLREDAYEPGYGTWTELVVTVRPDGWGFSPSSGAVPWSRPPKRADLVAEQRRFPAVRRVRKVLRARQR